MIQYTLVELFQLHVIVFLQFGKGIKRLLKFENLLKLAARWVVYVPNNRLTLIY